jgi:hypothetical protein
MCHLSIGWLTTFLGAAFGAGLVTGEPLMALYARLMLRWRAHGARIAHRDVKP